MKNIEIKARYNDFAHARRCVAQLGGAFSERLEQTDVYFRVPNGRLKLRHIRGRPANLIFYRREDRPEARESSYEIYRTEQPQELEQVLAAAFGVVARVVKRRELLLIDNVRVHLDTVEQLGTFIEFEAVLQAGREAAAEKARLDRYLPLFGVEPDAVLAHSYLDLLLAAKNTQKSG